MFRMACGFSVSAINSVSVNSSKPAPKKLVAKTSAKRRPATKAPARRQMTKALAEARAVGSVDGPKIDIVAFLRTLR